MVGGPGTPALLSGYPTMSGFGATVPSPGMYYNRDYAPSGFPKPSVECPSMKSKGASCWVEGGYEWRGTRQQCGSKFVCLLMIQSHGFKKYGWLIGLK